MVHGTTSPTPAAVTATPTPAPVAAPVASADLPAQDTPATQTVALIHAEQQAHQQQQQQTQLAPLGQEKSTQEKVTGLNWTGPGSETYASSLFRLQIRCWKLCARLTPSPPCHQSRRRSTTSRTRYRRRRRLSYRSTRSTRIPAPPQRRRHLCPSPDLLSQRTLLLLQLLHPRQVRGQCFLPPPCRHRRKRPLRAEMARSSRNYRYVPTSGWDMHVSCLGFNVCLCVRLSIPVRVLFVCLKCIMPVCVRVGFPDPKTDTDTYTDTATPM